MKSEARIGGRSLGEGHPAYLVAEMSGNHGGSLDRAVETVRAAAECGADAIKLQTYTPGTLTIDCDNSDFIIPGEGPWGGRKLYALYEEAQTPWEWHGRLFEEARRCGIEIFSTPFDADAVEFLEGLSAPAYKIASFELVHDELLATVARTGKPVILSTGMATLEEIGHAVQKLHSAGCSELVLLQCTSSYPAPDEEMHLSTIPLLSKVFTCPVGLSDHSIGTTAAVVAVTLGARFVEKHFTLSREDGGVDSHFSLEPREFGELVVDVRRAESMIGAGAVGLSRVEQVSTLFRRSLYVVEDIEKGAPLTRENVRAIRPGHGLPPEHLEVVLGFRAPRLLKRGTPLTWDLLKKAVGQIRDD